MVNKFSIHSINYVIAKTFDVYFFAQYLFFAFENSQRDLSAFWVGGIVQITQNQMHTLFLGERSKLVQCLYGLRVEHVFTNQMLLIVWKVGVVLRVFAIHQWFDEHEHSIVFFD
ncbi:hypothetical protein WK78_26500 [Burkholderia cepacia]|nr:hypothetical protein WK78_26500 [Burkholderia cepacia]